MNDDFYGDRFRWFTGVVKDVSDDGRVRVRIFGIHGTEDTTRISDGDLPYAMVLFPTTGGQTSGGNASHGLVNGTWVVGFFADHEDSQQPIILGVINGGRGSVNNSPAGQAPPPSYSDSGSILTPDTGSVQTPPTTQLTGSGNPQKIYNFFWEKITALNAVGPEASLKAICAGIIGVLQGESGPSIDPTAYNSIGAFGICQWLGPRKQKLSGPEWHGSLVSKTNAPSLEKQLDFMWYELTGSEKNVFAKMLTAQNIEDAVAYTNMFERDESCFEPGSDGKTPRKPLRLLSECNRNHPNYPKKLKFGRAAYENLSYTATGGRSSSVLSSSAGSTSAATSAGSSSYSSSGASSSAGSSTSGSTSAGSTSVGSSSYSSGGGSSSAGSSSYSSGGGSSSAGSSGSGSSSAGSSGSGSSGSGSSGGGSSGGGSGYGGY